jgi:phage terminase large subunit-like protein
MVVHRMPERPPSYVPGAGGPQDLDVADYRNWKPEAQQRALEMLREHEQSTWRPFYCPLAECDGHPHADWTWEHARLDQRPPPWDGDWLTLLLAGGRGSGKTRTGSEITHRVTAHTPRIALIAATGPDLRDTIVEGVSGILATAPPGKRPDWEPSKKKLTWPNGCIAQGFSAEEPDRLRGPQFGFAWADEPAHFPLVQDVWDNMLFGLRLPGSVNPKVVATSTPKPTKWMKATAHDPKTVMHRVSTYANLVNLAEPFKEVILSRYEGTRLGRQELHGEIISDVEGALWTWDLFDWVLEAPPLVRIVIGVDPAGTANAKSDETGIIAVGASADGHLYVLADRSDRYSPGGWASTSNSLYEDLSADAIVPEKNYGGDMVRHTLESSGFKGARILPVTSRRGKAIRAEPIVALYEKGKVHHVGAQGGLSDLEDELTSWVPGQGDSPNRLDALVHAATELARALMPAAVANPNRLRGLSAPTGVPARHLRSVG